jgi:hypothetical protein
MLSSASRVVLPQLPQTKFESSLARRYFSDKQEEPKAIFHISPQQLTLLCLLNFYMQRPLLNLPNRFNKLVVEEI